MERPTTTDNGLLSSWATPASSEPRGGEPLVLVKQLALARGLFLGPLLFRDILDEREITFDLPVFVYGRLINSVHVTVPSVGIGQPALPFGEFAGKRSIGHQFERFGRFLANYFGDGPTDNLVFGLSHRVAETTVHEYEHFLVVHVGNAGRNVIQNQPSSRGVPSRRASAR